MRLLLRRSQNNKVEPTVLSRLVLARFNLLGPTRSTVPVWRPCYVIAKSVYAACGAVLGVKPPAEGPSYCALPNPRIGKKMIPKKAKPIPKPAPLPKLFAKSMQRIMQIIKFTNGINIKMIHQAGRPTILHQM